MPKKPFFRSMNDVGGLKKQLAREGFAKKFKAGKTTLANSKRSLLAYLLKARER